MAWSAGCHADGTGAVRPDLLGSAMKKWKERPVEIELEDCQIEWFIKNPTDKILELFPDDQADQVVITSMKNCIDLIDCNAEDGFTHPDDIEYDKKLKEACLIIIDHFGTEQEE